MTETTTPYNPSARTEAAIRVTWVGFFVNLALTVAKLLAGFFGHSAAMIADGVHSLSDFFTDIVVIIFVRISGKGCDAGHDYGHEKFETFATFIISVALLGVGILLLVKGTLSIIDIVNGNLPPKPSIIALAAAAVSIVTKEILFRYTKRVGQKIESQAVIANAWHHRSDALSSIGTLIGIGGAIALGGKWVILDPIACVVVSALIIKVSVDLGKPSVNELLERSLSNEIEERIIETILQTEKVVGYHKLKTRQLGNVYIIDVHVQMPKTISFVESHEAASSIERQLRETFGEQTQIYIHTEPV